MNALSKYTVCNILTPDGSSYYKSPFEPNNWLLSDLIQVREANRVNVTVKYSIGQCPPSALYCKEYLDAYVWESQSIVVRDKIPLPINSNGSYRRFASFNRQSSGFTVVTVPLVLSRRYFVLGFRDQGGCRILNSVKVTYNVCPQTTLSRTLVSVPRTVTPSNDRESISVLGECSANSVPVSNSLNVLCESNGEWNITGLGVGCVCKEDMENIGGKCAGEYHAIKITGKKNKINKQTKKGFALMYNLHPFTETLEIPLIDFCEILHSKRHLSKEIRSVKYFKRKCRAGLKFNLELKLS